MSLKELRLKHSYSQEKLADLAKLSTRTIQRIEKENKASVESLRALSEVFNLEIQELKTIIENQEEQTQNHKKQNHKSFFEYTINQNTTKNFLFINIFLFILNLFTSEYYWFIYPLFIWGFFHFKTQYKNYQKFKLS